MATENSKEEKILDALRKAPGGLWVRELARRTGIDKSTVSRCLEAAGREIESEYLGRNKVYRLK